MWIGLEIQRVWDSPIAYQDTSISGCCKTTVDRLIRVNDNYLEVPFFRLINRSLVAELSAETQCSEIILYIPLFMQ
jgi:hypothetical protein